MHSWSSTPVYTWQGKQETSADSTLTTSLRLSVSGLPIICSLFPVCKVLCTPESTWGRPLQIQKSNHPDEYELKKSSLSIAATELGCSQFQLLEPVRQGGDVLLGARLQLSVWEMDLTGPWLTHHQNFNRFSSGSSTYLLKCAMFGKTFTKKFCRQLHHNLFCICTVAISISKTHLAGLLMHRVHVCLCFLQKCHWITLDQHYHLLIKKTITYYYFGDTFQSRLICHAVEVCSLSLYVRSMKLRVYSVDCHWAAESTKEIVYALCDLSICLIIVLTGDNPPGFISSSDRVARLYRLISHKSDTMNTLNL